MILLEEYTLLFCTNSGQNNSGQSETNLAVTLVGITTMHLICNALRVFLAVYAVSFSFSKLQTDYINTWSRRDHGPHNPATSAKISRS